MSSAAENNSEVVAAETVKTAGDKEPEVTPGSPGAAEEEDPKAEIKGTKRPAEVSIPSCKSLLEYYCLSSAVALGRTPAGSSSVAWLSTEEKQQLYGYMYIRCVD